LSILQKLFNINFYL